MTSGSSYNIQEFTATTEGEVNRLKSQVTLFWDKELRMYREFGLVDGIKIIECGSGPGYFLEKMLRTFPNIKVTGIEIDPYLVDVSRKTLSEFPSTRYEIYERSIMDTGMPDNSFDFVFTRLVLEHLPDPAGAVKELFRILKPSGKAVLIDNDFEMHLVTVPHIPELDILYEAYCSARIKEGGNPKIGRELPNLLKSGGFTNIGLEVAVAHSQLVGDKIFLQSEGVGISSQLVKDGYLDREILDVIAKKWSSLLKQENHSLYRQLFVAVGEKGSDKKEAAEHEIYMPTESSYKFDHKKFTSGIIEEQRKQIDDYLCSVIAHALEIDAIDVTVGSSIIDLGFDSLAAVDVQAVVEEELGIQILVTEFFELDKINKISKIVYDRITGKIKDDFTSTGQAKNISVQINKTEPPWEEGEI